MKLEAPMELLQLNNISININPGVLPSHWLSSFRVRAREKIVLRKDNRNTVNASSGYGNRDENGRDGRDCSLGCRV